MNKEYPTVGGGDFSLLESVMDNIGHGIFAYSDSRERVLYANRKIKQEFPNAYGMGTLADTFSDCIRSVNKNQYTEIMGENGRWYEAHATQVSWADGESAVLCTVYDITEKKMYQEKLVHQAEHDHLTGLGNRLTCERELESVMAHAVSEDTKGAVIYIDLDDFKSINDSLGHHYGDQLLKNIADSLNNVDNITNYCYRLAGDEFIIVVPAEEYDKLDTIIDDIEAVFSRPWVFSGVDCYCTASMGVVVFPDDGDSVSDIMKKADIALYEAKKGGKNRVEFYSTTVGLSSYRRLDMEKNMRKAAANNCDEFQVYYQPVFDMQKDGENKCCGAEALVRWNNSQLGFIPPSDFIPLAEYLGLINPIGSFVLKQACRDCKHWNDMGFEYKVNVNLSVVQLLQNDICEIISDVLDDTGLNPRNLTLEVTESLAINDMERMKNILGSIKERGVRIALDDFGTGYSSLNHIKEMPLDVIKVDQFFISGISRDDYAQAFVKMVTELANALGVTVCVEGVENDRQLEVLKDLKVKLHQGYYYDKPMSRNEFEEKYAKA